MQQLTKKKKEKEDVWDEYVTDFNKCNRSSEQISAEDYALLHYISFGNSHFKKPKIVRSPIVFYFTLKISHALQKSNQYFFV